MKKSFTLIELLIVIAIIGLLVIIIAIPINRARRGASIARILQYEASLHRYLGADIVGWWKFDGDLTDISGYNNHGSMQGGEEYGEGVYGKEGNSLILSDNGSNFVRIPNFPMLSGEKRLTISGWIKEEKDTGTRYFIWASNNLLIEFGSIVSPTDPSNLRLRWHLQGGWRSNHIVEDILEKDRWIFWTFVFNSGITEIYKDGEKVYQGNDNQQFISDNVVNYDIGYRPTGRQLVGKIDDVRIYKRDLSSEEIKTIYTETKDKYLTEN